MEDSYDENTGVARNLGQGHCSFCRIVDFHISLIPRLLGTFSLSHPSQATHKSTQWVCARSALNFQWFCEATV